MVDSVKQAHPAAVDSRVNAALEELLSLSSRQKRLLTLLSGVDFTEDDKVLWAEEVKRERKLKASQLSFIIGLDFENESKAPIQRLSFQPFQRALCQKLYHARALTTDAEDAHAKLVMDTIAKVCNDWSVILHEHGSSVYVRKQQRFFSDLQRECAAVPRLRAERDTPRQRHLSYLLAVQKFFEPLGPQKVPRQLTWNFLRNPWYLMAVSDTCLSVIRLQNGREIHRSNHSSAEASLSYQLVLFKLSRGAHQTLSGAAKMVGLRGSSSDSPIESDDLIIRLTSLSTLELFWRWSGHAVQPDRAPLATPASQVFIKDSTSQDLYLQAGVVAISKEHCWFACWAQSGVNVLVVCDLISLKSSVLEQHAARADFDDWEIFGLVAAGNLLFAGNDDKITVYKIARDGPVIAGVLLCSQRFELFKLYIHIEDFVVRDGLLAILLHANLPLNDGAFNSRVDVFPIDPIDLSIQPLQQLYGKFAGMDMGGDYIITLSLQGVVEIWPCQGALGCLMRFNDLGTMVTVFALNKGIQARMIQLREQVQRNTEGVHDTVVASDHQWSEEAAVISPTEAEVVADELWASSVGGTPQMPSTRGDSIVLLSFDRCTKELEDALIASPPSLALSGRGHDVKPSWAGGAKIFVEEITAVHLEPPAFDGELRPWHVILREIEEEALWDALQGLPIRYKKIKPCSGRVALPDVVSLMNGSDEGSHEHLFEDEVSDNPASSQNTFQVQPYRVVRTFIEIDIPSKIDSRSVRSA